MAGIHVQTQLRCTYCSTHDVFTIQTSGLDREFSGVDDRCSPGARHLSVLYPAKLSVVVGVVKK